MVEKRQNETSGSAVHLIDKESKDKRNKRVIKWPHNTMEFKLQKCSVCGTYWVPEKQVAYIAATSGTPVSDYDACPDCR